MVPELSVYDKKVAAKGGRQVGGWQDDDRRHQEDEEDHPNLGVFIVH